MKRVVLAILVLAMLFGAAGCSAREYVLSPDDPNTIANGGQPVFVQPAGCTDPNIDPDLVWLGESEEISWCQPATMATEIDVVDMAMVGTLVTPWPGDEEIVAVVWAGKTVVKLVLVAGSAWIVGNGITQFARHSNPLHDPRTSQTARDNINKVWTDIQLRLSDPNGKEGPILYCAVVTFQNSVQYIRVLSSVDGATGIMGWYGPNGWVGAFDNKDVEGFLNGLPRGALSYDTGRPLQDCLNALGGGVPAANHYAP